MAIIVSASRRTDIPAFYTEWLFNRLHAGFVLVRNPMRFHQVTCVSLEPKDVDCLVFWSKNPSPLLQRLNELDAWDCAFHITLTGYGTGVEPGVPHKAEVLEAFRTLAARFGPHRVIWRYDPVLLHDAWTLEAHRRNFGELCAGLAGSTHRCVLSFLDLYPSGVATLRKAGLSTPCESEMVELAPFFAETAARFGMTVEACAEPADLSRFGILPGHCIDPALTGVVSNRRDKGQRPHCNCQPSVDIGAYHSCPHRCRYCYANHGDARVKRNLAMHDPASPLMIGHLGPLDEIRERKG